MSKIKILPAKRKHRHDIKQINEICLPENYPMELWEEILLEHHSYVLMNNSIVIGFCCIARNSIMSFAILPEYRGRKLGKMLIEHSLGKYEQSVKKGYINNERSKMNKVNITLHVRIDNTIAQNLYKSVGFEIIETINKYYGSIDGYMMKKVF